MLSETTENGHFVDGRFEVAIKQKAVTRRAKSYGPPSRALQHQDAEQDTTRNMSSFTQYLIQESGHGNPRGSRRPQTPYGKTAGKE